jgi:hypothetical protein
MSNKKCPNCGGRLDHVKGTPSIYNEGYLRCFKCGYACELSEMNKLEVLESE